MSSSLNLSEVFSDAITQHILTVKLLEQQRDSFEQAAMRMTECLLQGKKVFWCGNGGSAAEAQHLAAELIGRFQRERPALASLALNSDSSVLTAIANDNGYEEVFVRQIEALCAAGDVVVGISTSGQSRNVCAALECAHDRGAFTIAMTGARGGRLAAAADISLRVPSTDTARIQEAHMLCGHILCEWIELATCITHVVSHEAPHGL